MSARIRRLPPQLVSQIAAGEVVERPASVVKELLENSLDAGATRIGVEVEQGGVRLVRVRDNGSGIDPGDLALALARHATSKIASFDDLQRVASLGFRGEALPSIASVSRLTLTSRIAGQNNGWRVGGDGGDAVDGPVPAPHPAGTTVEARDLFFNVPARRKFLRGERTEFGHIEDSIRRLALSRFEVGFSLWHNQRQVLDLEPVAGLEGWSRRVAEPACAPTGAMGACGCGAGLACRRSPAPSPTCSFSLSTGGRYATGSSPTPCGRPIRTCSIGTAIRRSCSIWNSIPPRWTSTPIPPSTRCGSGILRPSMSSSAGPARSGWPAPGRARCHRR